MKKYTHAWLAFMAIKRLEVIATTNNPKVIQGVSDETLKEAKALVKWFKDYRDFIIQGAWYPDEVFKDMSTSHIVKFEPAPDGTYTKFDKLPSSHTIYNLMKKVSPLYGKPYTGGKGNCADRCESISHSIVDNFKMLHKEDRGCPIVTTGNHIALRFFILSHYRADCHMPLHCDARPFSDEKGIHGAIEKKWEDHVNKSYKLDKDNNRFYYDPEGYPLPLTLTPLIQNVEEDVATRKYVQGWGDGNNNTWDYMSAVAQYSYLFSYYLVPETFKNTQGMDEFMEQTEWGRDFDKYSEMIFGDAIDSIARIWLRVWIKYRKWLK